MPAHAAFIETVCRVLAAAGDPQRAAGQQRYMRSAMPYHGVTSGELARLLRPLFADSDLQPATREDWLDTAKTLWDNATHREQRYAVQALLARPRQKSWLDPKMLPLLRHCIVTGAWWDHVDDLASHHVGDLLRRYRRELTPVLTSWATDEDLWLRRTAIICQLGHKQDTDLDLLTAAIEANLEGTTYGSVFWIRKAIGWALRQQARTDPVWVSAFVAARADRLSGLSRREALKHLGGDRVP